MDYSFDNLLYKYGSVSFYRDGEHVIEQFYGAPLSEPLFEAYLHTFAYESGLAVPRIEEVFSHGENCYIVYECPTVIKLSELLTDGFTDELLSRFVELQVKVHGKKAPKMHTVKINNFHDFTILNMYFNTIDPKEKLELIRQLL